MIWFFELSGWDMPSSEEILIATFRLAVYLVAQLVVVNGIIPSQHDVKTFTINARFGASAANWPFV
jgi:hypothetical protein